MDQRSELKIGTILPFPGMACVIQSCVGRGSNAMVYEGSYQDVTNTRQSHRVLIKELFPYEAGGHIWRDEQQAIRWDKEGEKTWALHRRSFERGNDVHLRLLAQYPDRIGSNLNTFAWNHTLYTLLDYSGGRSLDKELSTAGPCALPLTVRRMIRILDALSVFHNGGFLHLDISADNILIIGQGEREQVMLIDYNSVHTLAELENGSLYFSAKEGYTAPEVRMGMTRDVGPCTDLFSVASVFYACLMGQPPSAVQLTRKNPPDAADSPAVMDAPATVREQIRRILRRGLCMLSDRRYQSCAEMMADFQELQDRLEGVGVTRAALWEAGRRNVLRLIRQNPSLSYVQREEELYPLRVCAEQGASLTAEEFMTSLSRGNKASAVLLGAGGMGKSTALLRAALASAESYAPSRAAVIYLSLFGWKRGGVHSILDRVLMELRFDERTKTMDDARHALISLLSRTPEKAPTLLLLLDGFNEALEDSAALAEEIGGLSTLPGLRMVVASRTTPEGLSLSQCAMVRLEEQDAREALGRHGLLLPESEEMRELLRNPMMLSIFIQTSKNTDHQLACQSEAELLKAYLDALCEKAAQEACQAVDYQVEAAVRFVLPAIAWATREAGGPLDDLAMYHTVERCYRALNSRALLRAFPEWLGHSREILGEQGGAEAWYGRVAHDILWRQLGLLVRDENGRCQILHQIFQDYLIARKTENDRRLRSRRRRLSAIAFTTVLLALSATWVFYDVWLKPKPYDTRMSETLMDAATIQYVNCGLQYESMLGLLQGGIDPDRCAAQVSAWGLPANRAALLAMTALMEGGGEVVPWSGKPFDFERAEVLLNLPVERADDYLRYIRAYERMIEETADAELNDFSHALHGLLEADADIAYLLDLAVCMPHVDGMSEAHRLSYETGLLSLPQAQEERSADLSRGIDYALEKANERRRQAINRLNQMPVMHDPYVQEDGL